MMGRENFTYNIVMLIDDSRIDNFVNLKVLERYGFCREVTAYTQQLKALEFLRKLQPGDAVPDVIFLDMNMHAMDGFEFLAQYRTLAPWVKEKCSVVVLSSTVNPADIQLAMRHHDVLGFFSKPLVKTNLDKLQRMINREAEMAF